MEIECRIDLSVYSFEQLTRFMIQQVISESEFNRELEDRGFDEWKRRMIIEGATVVA